MPTGGSWRAKLGDEWPCEAVSWSEFRPKEGGEERDRLIAHILQGTMLSCSATGKCEWLDLACSLEFEGVSPYSCLSAIAL